MMHHLSLSKIQLLSKQYSILGNVILIQIRKQLVKCGCPLDF